MSLAVVAKQFASSLLRHEEIETPVVVEVAEHRPDFTGSERDSGILGQDKLLTRVDDEHACAGAVKEIRPAVIIDVGDCESVAFDIAADAVRSQSDLDRDIFEQPAHDLRLLDFCREIKRPLASALANLEQQGVFTFL